MASAEKKVISLKNVTCQTSTTITGNGDFIIDVGLNSEDTVCMIQKDCDEETKLCVPLFAITIWPTNGITITPTNKDLKCFVNDKIITSETNLLPGSTIEIGDKILQFFDGPVPRMRRHLPPTPGVCVLPAAPPKPNRKTEIVAPANKAVKEPEYCNVYRDWCVVHPPTLEEELISQLETKEEIANLAASYLNRQINMHTDTRMTSATMDEVFKVLQDIAYHRKDILVAFLKEIARELNEVPSEDRPHHEAVICLLVEMIKQFLDPISQVILVLQLLRSLSHIHCNLPILIKCHAPAAVLGTMSAYINEAEVQLNAIDILAKIATYIPLPNEKIPMREPGVELLLRAVQRHSSYILIVQSGCRTLSNLATMLYERANQIIDSGNLINSEHGICLSNLMALLEYMYENCMAVVQNGIRDFSDDLTVKTDGRKFLYIMAKLTQLQQRKNRWLKMLQEKESLVQNLEELSDDSNSPLVYHQKSNNSNSHPTPYNVIDGDNPQITTGVANDHHRDESIPIQVEQKDVSILEKDYRVAGPVKIKETNSEGILKRSRSYENLRNSERRVNFDDDIAPGVYDSSSTSSSDVEETGLEDGAGDIGNISESTAKVNINSTVEENTANFTKTEDQTYGMISDTAKHNLAKTKTKKITAYDNPIYMERGCEILQNHTNDSSLNINTPEITPSAKNVLNTDDGWRDENEANKNVSSYDEIDIVHALVRCQPSQTQNSDISQSGSQVSQPGSHISKSQVSQPNRNVILEKNSSHDTIKQNIKSQSIKPEPKETTDTLTNSMDDIRHNHNEDSRDVFLSSSSSEVLNSRSAKVETVSGQLAFVNSLDCFEDLTDCSAEDINFLSRLTKAQIVCRVCSLALQDEDRRAYSILDQPLRDVLEQEHLSKVLQQFVAKQYKSEHTLMDLDPSTAISLIDAVRYRSQVAPDVVQNTLVGVVRNINDHLRPCCLHLALAFFNNIFNDFSLKTIVSDPNFCAKCLHYLENAVGTLQDRSGSDSVIGKLRNIMGFIK